MKINIRKVQCSHRTEKKIVSIKPVCTKDKPCDLCAMLGYSKNDNNPQCRFCNLGNKLIVRCE